MFYFVGIVLTFFLTVLLVTKKDKTVADHILTIWLAIIGLHLFFVFLTLTNQVYSYPYLIGIHLPMPLLHEPFLFLYTGAITNQQVASKYSLVHFIPFFLTYFLFLPFYLLPSEQRIMVYKNEGQGYETQMLILLIFIVISGVVYTVSSLWLLRRHKKNIGDQFSSADKINLQWLRYLIYGIGIIWLFVIFGNDVMTFNAVVVFVFFIGYFGIKQVGIFSQQSALLEKQVLTEPTEILAISTSSSEINTIANEQRKAKYLRSSLNESAAQQIHESLVESMCGKKFFLNPEITLGQLAQALNVHPHNLSQVINTFEGKTFYDYINHQRIKEFKRIVTIPENHRYTLLALAHDCGFNSKTSFNRNFKNATGFSPSEYLKQTHINLQDQ